MRTPFLALSLLSAAAPLAAQIGPVLSPQSLVPGHDIHRCGTPTSGGAGPIDNPNCSGSNTNPLPQYDGPLVRIPVVVHVIRTTNGQGDLTNAQVQSQIDVLNEDFRGTGQGTGGYDTKIEFVLATSDPQGQATNGVVRHTNNQWFNDSGDYWTATAWDTTRYLNIYTNNAGGGGVLGYVPSLPQSGQVLNTPADRVVIYYRAFGRPGTLFPYNQGRTCTHEVGHYLGLLHTFQGGCGSSSCYSSGDLICDTAAEANPRLGCPTTASSCGSPDPVRNYMDYTDDACMNNFTQEQSRRMRCTLQSYRPSLAVPAGPIASATTRDGAGNYNGTLNAGPPALGTTVTVSALTFGLPFTLAGAYAYTGQANVPFQGYTILVDQSSFYLFDLPFKAPASGVVATWSLSIPNDPGLAGLPISMQGLLLGSTFGLTNAVDMVVGN